MTAAEIDDFLAAERTCRVATVKADGAPHCAPLWFVWDGRSLWLNSLVRSQRWADLERDPRVSAVVDAGHDFTELRGVELSGRVEIVGDVPRGGQPDSRLAVPERLFADKYTGGGEFVADGRHGWLRVVVEKTASWDFRKTPGLASART